MIRPQRHIVQGLEKHIERFIRQYQLFDKFEPLYIAVSGGVDSMVLLSVLLRLRKCGYSNEIHVLHVNHGTRPGQDQDEMLIREFCASNNVKCSVKRLTDLPQSNFEMLARQERYQFFYEKAQGHKILLAHHIDDSLEWSMMQQFKSASLKTSLGIPVINGQIRRPLMAASRRQIELYAQLENVPFREDPTNQLNTHERNGIRKWLKGIRFRYPSLIQNYVGRQTALAHQLGLHAQKQQGEYQVIRGQGLTHIIPQTNQHDFIQLKQILRQEIPLLSGKARGRIRAQLDKVQQLITNQKIGPLSFSGGALLYNFAGHLLLKSAEAKILTPNPAQFSPLAELSYTDFEKVWMQTLTLNSMLPFYPLWVIVPAGQWVQCPRVKFPAAQQLTDYCQQHQLQLITARQLSLQWSKKGNYKKTLRLQIASGHA